MSSPNQRKKPMLKFFKFSAKGRLWCKRKELGSFEDAYFVQDDQYPALVSGQIGTIPFEIEDGVCVLSRGGALYGDDWASFKPRDSFYEECQAPPSWGTSFAVDSMLASPPNDDRDRLYRQAVLRITQQTRLPVFVKARKFMSV